jgi:molecular chaperone GrpE
MSFMPQDNITSADDAAMDAALAAEIGSRSDSATERKIADLEVQLKEAGERALRAQAELENVRKRMQRELAEERRYAIVPLVRDLLSDVDNLERAMDAASTNRGADGATAAASSDEAASLLAGVKMVASQLESVLKQHQCVRIEASGAPFDPHLHEAIAQEPSSEHAAGTVTRAVQAGYKLHDRVVRPAQVFVSTGPAN